MKANHYAQRRPTVIIYEGQGGEEDAIETKTVDGIEVPHVFKNLRKAQRYVYAKIDAKEYPFIRFANENPEMGAGDREETNNRRCLRCNGFMRLSLEESVSRMPDGSVMSFDVYDCPKCDLGE